MRKLIYAVFCFFLITFYVYAQGTSMTIGSGGGTSVSATTCTNQFITAIAASTGAGTCTTDTLASAQHANQGTTTQVLHGNAAGNPSWAAVNLTNDVTGALAATQTVTLGSSAGTATLGGTLCKGTPNATTTGTIEQILATCTIPGGSFTTGGNLIKIYFRGRHKAGNSNSITVSIRLNGIAGTIYASQTGTVDGALWGSYGVQIQAISATSQAGWGQMQAGVAGAAPGIAGAIINSSSINMAGDIPLVITATTGTAAGDFILDAYLVQLFQ